MIHLLLPTICKFNYETYSLRNQRWLLELSIGAGVYSLQHDKFYNYTNGLKAYTEHKTYWGIDQAALSLCYAFDLWHGSR